MKYILIVIIVFLSSCTEDETKVESQNKEETKGVTDVSIDLMNSVNNLNKIDEEAKRLLSEDIQFEDSNSLNLIAPKEYIKNDSIEVKIMK